jgi:hypothetical protein
MKILRTAIISLSIILLSQACKVSYGFNDAGSLPATVKTIKIAPFENKAKYINPQLAQKFTDKVQQKIIGSTRLTRTNNDDADYVINGVITTYDPTQTVGVSAQQASTNRLTITIHVIWKKDASQNREVEEFDVSRSFDYSAKLTLQQAEGQLIDDAVRSLTDDIFNKMFSNW